MKFKDKYDCGEYVRVKHGCVWLYGVIAEVINYNNSTYYEVDYGSRDMFEKYLIGSGAMYFAHFNADELAISETQIVKPKE